MNSEGLSGSIVTQDVIIWNSGVPGAAGRVSLGVGLRVYVAVGKGSRNVGDITRVSCWVTFSLMGEQEVKKIKHNKSGKGCCFFILSSTTVSGFPKLQIYLPLLGPIPKLAVFPDASIDFPSNMGEYGLLGFPEYLHFSIRRLLDKVLFERCN